MSQTDKVIPNHFPIFINWEPLGGRYMNSGIYCIKNIVNGKIYIGQTIDLDKRYKEHLRELKNNYHFNEHLQKSFIKYGEESFEFIVLEKCDKDKLNDLEMHYIQRFNSLNRNSGYNLRAGGIKPTLTEESKKKISKTRTERLRNGLIKVTQVKFTDEVRAKMSESSKRRFTDYKHKENLSVKQSTIDIEIVKDIKRMLREDVSVKDIVEITGVGINKINHISNLNSFTYLLPEYNYYIKNRSDILGRKKAKAIMNMYRDGCTYQTISDTLSINIRTTIRIVNENKTNYDDLQRINAINYKKKKQYSMIKTMYSCGKTKRFIAKHLKVSQKTINEIINM